MNDTQNGQVQIPSFSEISEGWHSLARNTQTFNRLLNTEAAIAQTPKQLIWTLNKTKLYR